MRRAVRTAAVAGMNQSYQSATHVMGLGITKSLLASGQEALKPNRRHWSCLIIFPVTGVQSSFTQGFLSLSRGQAGWDYLCSRQWSPRGWPRCSRHRK